MNNSYRVGNETFTHHHPCNAFSAYNVMFFVQYEANLALQFLCRWLDATVAHRPYTTNALQLVHNQLIIHAEMFTREKRLLPVCTLTSVNTFLWN